MLRGLAVLALLMAVLAFPMVMAGQAGNLISNGDFEDPNGENWWYVNSSAFAVVTDIKHSGERSLRGPNVDIYGGAACGNPQTGNRRFGIVVTPGAAYDVSAYAYTSVSASMRMQVRWYADCTDQSFEQHISLEEAPPVVSERSWQHFSLHVVAPANARVARIYFHGETTNPEGGYFYYDDIFMGPPTASATATATSSATPSATATVGPGCVFSDVCPGQYFFEPVKDLVERGAISGYDNNTFRPFNNATRAQLLKIEAVAEGWELIDPAQPRFSDVPRDHPFYRFIETAAALGVVSGRSDGSFKPYDDITRGQLAKVVVAGAEWPLLDPATPTFEDVDKDNAFYKYIETAYSHSILGGYDDHTFRWQNNATRGQIAKIVYLASSSGKKQAAD